MVTRSVRQQYRTTDPLQTRIETHRRYSERQVDLDAACRTALGLTGDEALLDVGCGPGDWPRYLRQTGHRGRLAGLDQSTAMIAAATAAAERLGIEWHRGEANALPFPDGSFAVITARHMLYHVSDIPGALREFARVVGPGGTVLAMTNGARSMPHLLALMNDTLAQFGLSYPLLTTATFAIENAPSILHTAFPEVSETILTNAFVFTTPEPIVAYVMTTMAVQQATDPPLHQAMQDWLLDQATRRLAAMGGTWRDPKDIGLYRCRVATA
jgi:ubiquinone/menaquinone biosynthesis C-methylase UbiE